MKKVIEEMESKRKDAKELEMENKVMSRSK